MSPIDDSDFQDLLKKNWSALCAFGYEQYLSAGRGVVVLERTVEDPPGQPVDEIAYVVHDHASGQPDADTAAMLETYDPEKELVLQYAKPDGTSRVMQLRASPGKTGPEEAWVDYVLEKAPPKEPDGP